jgi:NADP-dependent 3-hydroxy acid dehydrogenase YdfG
LIGLPSGAVVLVTGAGGDLGSAIAEALAEAGARLVLVGRRREPLEQTAARLASATDVFPTDLTDDDDLRRLVGEVQSRYERLDVLVHCAGIYHRAPIDTASIDDLDTQFRANVRAPYQLTAALLGLLLASTGQVVFVNSTQGLSASATLGQYGATQHALRAVADSLRDEVNERGIRVLTVHLGRTATSRQARVFAGEGRTYQPERLLQPQDVASVIACCIGLPRTAEVTTLNIRPMQKVT